MVTLLVGARVVEDCAQDLEKELILENWIILEPEIGGILIWLIVVENIIAINGPSASNPLMDLLVEDALFGKLVLKLLLSGNLELSVHSLALIVVMLVMVIIVAMTTCASH